MALDQTGERLLGMVPGPGAEPLQELPVGELRRRSQLQQCAELAQDAFILSRRHSLISRPAVSEIHV